MLKPTDLFKPQTADQIFVSFISSLQSMGIPANAWRKGGSFRAILRVVATLYALFSQVIASFISSAFLETASGDWLRLLAINVFGVTPIDATFATGSVTLTNTRGGIFTFGPGEVTVKNSASGKTYVNADAFSLTVGQTLPIDIVAQEIGSASTSNPGEIDTIVTTMLGVTVTNPLAVVGNDAELDDDLKSRCQDSRPSRSIRGPRGAYVYYAKTAFRSDGSIVNINRVTTSAYSSTGVVDVYCASPSGTPTSDDLAAAGESIEENVRPDTVTVNMHGVTDVSTSQAITVWAKKLDGVVASNLQAAVLSALAAAIKSYPIGGIAQPPSTTGYLYRSFIEGTCKAVDPSIFNVTGVADDIAIPVGAVAALAATVDVRLVDASVFGS